MKKQEFNEKDKRSIQDLENEVSAFVIGYCISRCPVARYNSFC